MSEGNGHVRVGAGDADQPDARRGRETGTEPEARDDALPRVMRPGPAALIALVLGAFAFGGWQVATWRVGEGTVVPCGSFTPNPDVWQDEVVRGADDADRGALRSEAWNAALRETEGTLRCAGLVGRGEREVRLLLGARSIGGGTGAMGMRSGEDAWAFGRRIGPAPGRRLETTAVIVRFSRGRAVSVRAERMVTDQP